MAGKAFIVKTKNGFRAMTADELSRVLGCPSGEVMTEVSAGDKNVGHKSEGGDA